MLRTAYMCRPATFGCDFTQFDNICHKMGNYKLAPETALASAGGNGPGLYRGNRRRKPIVAKQGFTELIIQHIPQIPAIMGRKIIVTANHGSIAASFCRISVKNDFSLWRQESHNIAVGGVTNGKMNRQLIAEHRLEVVPAIRAIAQGSAENVQEQGIRGIICDDFLELVEAILAITGL